MVWAVVLFADRVPVDDCLDKGGSYVDAGAERNFDTNHGVPND